MYDWGLLVSTPDLDILDPEGRLTPEQRSRLAFWSGIVARPTPVITPLRRRVARALVRLVTVLDAGALS